MKRIVRKTLFIVVLVLSAGMYAQAQVPYFKNLSGEIQSVQKQFVPDKRLAVLDISLQDTLQTVVVLKGRTDLPEAKKRIFELLSSRGIRFIDSVKVLPDVALGDKTWGVASLSVSNMRSLPDHAAELVSQALMGTPLKVLEYRDGWYLVQTPDLYLGWMEGRGFEKFTQAELDHWKKSDRYVFNRVAGKAVDEPTRKSRTVTDLVLGDLFEADAKVNGFLKIRTPDGRTGFVRKKECLSWDEWTSQRATPESIISVARQFLGIPYLWGGTSCKATDCSGLTKTVYYSHAIILARDASQQVRYGEHPDFNRMETLLPGDLLFFGRNAQRVTHVGMYLGNGKYIQASGFVRISSIDPKDPDFDLTEKKKLVGAGRILNSLNTEGIVPVKEHPWYGLHQTPASRGGFKKALNEK